jgi:hypothetical protein
MGTQGTVNYRLPMTKSIRDILNPQAKALKDLSHIHSLIEDKSYVEAVLRIAEYGFMRFFQHYRAFLGSSYDSETIRSLYWEEAFQVFIHPYYSQLWRGLESPPKEKKRSSKHEWYDNLVLGHV